DAGAYRAKTERRIDELNASLQRERVELAVARAGDDPQGLRAAATRYIGRAGSAAAWRHPRGGLRHRQRAVEIEKRQRRRPRSQGGGDGAARRRSGAPVHAIPSLTAKLPSARRAPTRGAARILRLPSDRHSRALRPPLPADLDGCIDIEHSKEWRTAWP